MHSLKPAFESRGIQFIPHVRDPYAPASVILECLARTLKSFSRISGITLVLWAPFFTHASAFLLHCYKSRALPEVKLELGTCCCCPSVLNDLLNWNIISFSAHLPFKYLRHNFQLLGYGILTPPMISLQKEKIVNQISSKLRFTPQRASSYFPWRCIIVENWSQRNAAVSLLVHNVLTFFAQLVWWLS